MVLLLLLLSHSPVLTLYPAPCRGWIAPYPARCCRTKSSCCSPQHTAGTRQKPWGDVDLQRADLLRKRQSLTFFSQPNFLVLFLTGSESQPSNRVSEERKKGRGIRESQLLQLVCKTLKEAPLRHILYLGHCQAVFCKNGGKPNYFYCTTSKHFY